MMDILTNLAEIALDVVTFCYGVWSPFFVPDFIFDFLYGAGSTMML